MDKTLDKTFFIFFLLLWDRTVYGGAEKIPVPPTAQGKKTPANTTYPIELYRKAAATSNLKYRLNIEGTNGRSPDLCFPRKNTPSHSSGTMAANRSVFLSAITVEVRTVPDSHRIPFSSSGKADEPKAPILVFRITQTKPIVNSGGGGEYACKGFQNGKDCTDKTAII